MSLLEPTLAEAATPEDFQRQAAERVTPIGEYLGAKLTGGLEATRPGEAYGLASLPSRYAPDEYGLPPPGPPPADLLTKEQFDSSPYKRPGLEYEEGETEARAAARAAVHDRQAYRDSVIARSDAGYLGQAAGVGLELGAAALDPTNYIPLIGEASKAAMLARFGRIGGSLLMHGSEAALNTGLFEPLAATTAQAQGRGYGWEDAGADILTNALGGAVLGTAVGEGARALGFGHGAARTSEIKPLFPEVPAARETGTADIPVPIPIPEAGAGVVPRRPGQPPVRVDDLMRRADAANLVLDQIDRGEPVDVGKVLANDPAVRALPEPPPGIDAYHGTPHLFDEFGHEKIGTGEGAQAFGHGIYFAERQDVAETYRKTIASTDKAAAGTAAYHLDLNGGDKEAAKADLQREIVNLEKRIGSALRPDADLQRRLTTNRGAVKLIDSAGAGNLYKVRLEMEHSDLLDWDKPLSEQSPKVQEALNESATLSPYIEKLPATATGADLYHALAGGMDITPGSRPDLASQMLKLSDIPGIRYLDAGSRDRTEGTRNIVVFDPDRIHVLERNGMSLEKAAPEPPHPSVAEAAARVGKDTPELETFAKDARLDGYEKPLPVYHATDAASFDAFQAGRRGAVYVSERPEGAMTGAQAGARERGATGGKAFRTIKAEVSGPIAYRDPPPGFSLPDSLRGADGYYDEAAGDAIKARIERFDAPGLSTGARDFARSYLRKLFDLRYDEVSGDVRKVHNGPRDLSPPLWPEFEHGLGARERGHSDGTFTVVGSKTDPETIRDALRALGYQASLVGDEGGHSIAAFPAREGEPITNVRFAEQPGEPAKPERPPTPAEKAAATAALPPELQEVEAMRREGTLTPADEATLAAGEKEAQQAEGYATAYETLLNCVLRSA